MARVDTRLEEIARRWSLEPAAVERLARLAELIATDPAAPTTVRELDRILDVHVADSLVALEVGPFKRARTVADIGSGAGFPGLALAATLDQAHVTLVESVMKKVQFLAKAVKYAGIENVAVAAGRVEQWDGRDSCDAVTARALAALPVVVEYAAPLLRIGGTLIAWRGRRDWAEEQAAARAAAIVGLSQVGVRPVRPYAQARDLHLHVFAKDRPTPPGFPRRPGMAAKNPLGG